MAYRHGYIPLSEFKLCMRLELANDNYYSNKEYKEAFFRLKEKHFRYFSVMVIVCDDGREINIDEKDNTNYFWVSNLK